TFVKMADQALIDEYKDRVEAAGAPMLTLADFTNIKLLCEGGFGKTYSATFLRTGQEVVLKQILIRREAQEQAIIHEIEIHRNMQFGFIARFIDQFREGDDEQYIVMEYCRGGDLYNYIKTLKSQRKLADENFVWNVVAQIVITVGYLHSYRVVHRDLKPENVFLTEDMEVRVGDFGISKVLDAQLSFALSMKGTLRYVSPELLLEKKFHKSGDIWGIGVTIYELLTQHRPFDGKNETEIQRKIVKEDPAPIPPQNCSDRLRNLVSAMLIKDRFKRISLNQILKFPEINQRIKAYAKEMIGTSQERSRVYLQHLIDDIDITPPEIPSISGINPDGSYSNPTQVSGVQAPIGSVRFDIKDERIATQRIGENSQSLTRLIQLSDQKRNTVSISPEIQAGIGVVQIAVRFDDAKGENRAYRWLGVIFSGYAIPDSYYPGQDEASAGYCGSDGSVVHITPRTIDKYIDGNSPYENGEIVIAEVNMHPEREKRTLHFFTNGLWQPIYFVGLPDRIKFCVQRYYNMTTAQVVWMKQYPTPTVVRDIPNVLAINW
ncbi:MAG: putative CAMK family protein kinase, partial [Streblomastix strix]